LFDEEWLRLLLENDKKKSLWHTKVYRGADKTPAEKTAWKVGTKKRCSAQEKDDPGRPKVSTQRRMTGEGGGQNEEKSHERVEGGKGDSRRKTWLGKKGAGAEGKKNKGEKGVKRN